MTVSADDIVRDAVRTVAREYLDDSVDMFTTDYQP